MPESKQEQPIDVEAETINLTVGNILFCMIVALVLILAAYFLGHSSGINEALSECYY